MTIIATAIKEDYKYSDSVVKIPTSFFSYKCHQEE